MARAPKPAQVNQVDDMAPIAPPAPEVPRIGGSFFVDADGKVTRTEWTRHPGEDVPLAPPATPSEEA